MWLGMIFEGFSWKYIWGSTSFIPCLVSSLQRSSYPPQCSGCSGGQDDPHQQTGKHWYSVSSSGRGPASRRRTVCCPCIAQNRTSASFAPPPLDWECPHPRCPPPPPPPPSPSSPSCRGWRCRSSRCPTDDECDASLSLAPQPQQLQDSQQPGDNPLITTWYLLLGTRPQRSCWLCNEM